MQFFEWEWNSGNVFRQFTCLYMYVLLWGLSFSKKVHIDFSTKMTCALYRGQLGFFFFFFFICKACLDELHESSLVLKHLSLRINSNPWISSSVRAATFDVHMLVFNSSSKVTVIAWLMFVWPSTNSSSDQASVTSYLWKPE